VLLSLLGEKDGVNVRKYSTLRDGDAGQKLVELFVVADGQLEMTGRDPRLAVVLRGVAGQLQDLGGEVPERQDGV
jgi:hypothetical protein